MSINAKQLFYDFGSLLFPRQCLCCGAGLQMQERNICLTCEHTLVRTDFHKEQQNKMFLKINAFLPITYAVAFLYYTKSGKVQALLEALKYKGKEHISRWAALQYAQELQADQFDIKADVVIPIPLHYKKLRIRGYNQSAGFAQGLAECYQIDYDDTSVLRKTHTKTQTKLGRFDRWNNVKEIFEVAHPKKLKNKRVLLVDDVITTGATIETCADKIISAGATSVAVASIACAVG
jgi:ComF family protein